MVARRRMLQPGRRRTRRRLRHRVVLHRRRADGHDDGFARLVRPLRRAEPGRPRTRPSRSCSATGAGSSSPIGTVARRARPVHRAHRPARPVHGARHSRSAAGRRFADDSGSACNSTRNTPGRSSCRSTATRANSSLGSRRRRDLNAERATSAAVVTVYAPDGQQFGGDRSTVRRPSCRSTATYKVVIGRGDAQASTVTHLGRRRRAAGGETAAAARTARRRRRPESCSRRASSSLRVESARRRSTVWRPPRMDAGVAAVARLADWYLRGGRRRAARVGVRALGRGRRGERPARPRARRHRRRPRPARARHVGRPPDGRLVPRAGLGRGRVDLVRADRRSQHRESHRRRRAALVAHRARVDRVRATHRRRQARLGPEARVRRRRGVGARARSRRAGGSARRNRHRVAVDVHAARRAGAGSPG